MTLDQNVIDLLKRFVAKFPPPVDSAAPFTNSTPDDVRDAHEERCRQWCVKFAQQVAFAFPARGYGMKRASKTRPLSKDTLARIQSGKLECWDLLTASATGAPRLDLTPGYHLLDAAQVFVPVDPVDHLDSAIPPITPPVVEPTPVEPISCKFVPCSNACKYDEATLLLHLHAALSSLTFEGKLFGQTITLKPKGA